MPVLSLQGAAHAMPFPLFFLHRHTSPKLQGTAGLTTRGTCPQGPLFSDFLPSAPLLLLPCSALPCLTAPSFNKRIPLVTWTCVVTLSYSRSRTPILPAGPRQSHPGPGPWVAIVPVISVQCNWPRVLVCKAEHTLGGTHVRGSDRVGIL